MTRYLRAVLLAIALLCTCQLTHAQGGNIGSNSSPAANNLGRPLPGVNVSICQPLATTSAQVITGNVAVLTMASNPITAGFLAGMPIMVSGFTGGDTYFNGGAIINGQITAGFTILSVSSTSITYPLTHAVASASSNGAVLQEGNSTTSCGGLSSIFADPGLLFPATQPIVTDALGGWNAYAAPAVYYGQFYGAGVSTVLKQFAVACVPSGATGTCGVYLNANNNFSGIDNFKNLEDIRFADQFPGADCGAKILAADADFANPKGQIWINRNCGLTISTWQTAGVTHSLYFIEGGIWNVATTLTQQHGGIDIVGLGLTDGNHSSLTGTGTGLLYTGTCGNDLISILGQAAPNRIDRVNLKGIRFDGNNCARYDVREEKVDTAEIWGSRLANATECNLYAVDATGIKMYNADNSFINKRAICLDWGTGGFGMFGGQIEQDVAGTTSPFVLIQGASNNIEFSQVQFDNFTSGNFGGFIQVTGFSTNSSLPSAPTGGAGAPTVVSFNNISTFYDGPVNPPSQGADILITGVSGQVSRDVTIRDSYLSASGLSPVAVKADFTTKLVLDHVLSTGHTTGVASTLQTTANSTQISMWEVDSLDTNRTNGTLAAIQDCNHSPSGTLSCSGAIQLTGGINSWLTLGSSNSGDPAAPIGSLFFRSDLSRLRFEDGTATFRTVPYQIAVGTSTLGSSSIGATTCNAAVTTAATGAASSDTLDWSYASAPSGTTDGKLILSAYATSGNVNFVLCNPTAGAITPSGLVVNWVVMRP